MLNKIKNAVKTVTSKFQFKRVISSIMKKDQIQIFSLEIEKKKKLKSTLELTRTPVSRIFSNGFVVALAVLRSGSRILANPKDFSWRFLTLSIKPNAKEYAEDLFGGTIALVLQPNGWVKVYLVKDNGKYLDLETGTVVAKIYGEVHIYKSLAWTASNKRQLSMVFMEVTHSDERFQILDRATLGALTKIYKKYGTDSSVDAFKKIQKAGGYVGNVLTGSISFGLVPGFVRFYSKWTNETPEYYLEDAYTKKLAELRVAIKAQDKDAIQRIKAELKKLQNIKHKASTQDGQLYINARVLADMLFKTFGVKVSPEILVGLILQVRPATVKASGLVVAEEDFENIVRNTYNMSASMRKDALVRAKEIEATEGKEAADKFIAKVAEGTKVVEIGDKNNMLFVADDNCIKLDFDMTLDITFEVLAFCKSSMGKSSKQMLESLLASGHERAMQLCYEIVRNDIDSSMSDLMESKARLLRPEEILDAVEKGYSTDVLLAMYPGLLQVSKAFFNSAWKQKLNSVFDKIDGMNGKLISHNRRLASDFTFILTNRKISSILKVGEVFINNSKISKVIMIKYPKMGVKEFYPAKNVSLKEIRKRLNDCVEQDIITKEQAKSVYMMYKNIDKDIAVLPGRMTTAAACAGLDFDYDGSLFLEYTSNPAEDDTTAILTNELIDILENFGMEAVIIDTNEDEE